MLYTHRYHGVGKALVFLGAAVCLGAAAFFIWSMAQPPVVKQAPPSMPKEASAPATEVPVVEPNALGAEGSACGGPVRYPCNPGLVCSVPPSQWATTYGKCVKDSRAVSPPGNVGAHCDAEHGCFPGLVCSPREKKCIKAAFGATATTTQSQ